jgi:hypothetical protein
MTRQTGDDPLDELRRSNPIETDDVPSASLARLRARTQEVIAMDHRPRRTRLPAPVAAGVAIVALVLVAFALLPGARVGPAPTAPPIAVASPTPTPTTAAPTPTTAAPTPTTAAPTPTTAAPTPTTAAPTPTTAAPTPTPPGPTSTPPGPTGPGGMIGACVEPYSLDALRRRAFAFDGTVTAIRGDEVTFSVRTRYRGPAIADPTLVATGMTGTSVTPGGGPTLTVGERYLVAGEDRFVWGCGYTQPYDPAVAADWATALR